MRVIQHNPYRYLGILANASAAEKLSAKNKIAAYLKIGKQMNTDFDFSPPLPAITRSTELMDAKSNEILTEENAFISTLFWFLSDGKDNEEGFEAIKSKSYNLALSSFESYLDGDQITTNNISAAINYSSLDIILFEQHKDENRLKNSLNIKLSIIIDETLRNTLLQKISINGMILSLESIKSTAISEMKDIIKNLMPEKNVDVVFNDYFSQQNEILTEYNEEKSKSLVKQIKTILLESEKKRKKYIEEYKNGDIYFSELCSNIADNGKHMLKLAMPLLIHLKISLGTSHPQTISTYTSFLDEINFSGLACFNVIIDKLSSSSKKEIRAWVKTIDTDELYKIIDLCKSSLDKTSEVSTLVTATIQDNLDEYIKFNDFIKKAKSNNESSGEWLSEGCLEQLIKLAIIFFIGFLIRQC